MEVFDQLQTHGLEHVRGVRGGEAEFDGNGVDQTPVTLDQGFPSARVTTQAQRYKFRIPERLVLIVAHLAQFPSLPERMDSETQGQKREDRSSENFPKTGRRLGELSIFVDAVETENTGEYQQECASDFKPKLMKRPDNAAEGQFESACHVRLIILLERPQIEN
jgi:hypothetical protein